MTTKEIFEQHLNEVASDKLLKQFSMEFYDDFCEYFQGQVFTKDNFETLSIYGEIVEQDIVKDLFKDRDEVLPEEVLTWLFTHHTEKLVPFRRKSNTVTGRIGALNGCIKIYLPKINKEVKRIEQEKLKTAFVRKIGMSDKDFNKYVKEQLKARKKEVKKNRPQLVAQVKSDIYQKSKGSLYHEFGHLFQLRTFCDMRYAKILLDKETQMRKSSGSCYEDKITNQTVYDSQSAFEMSCECNGRLAMQQLFENDEKLIKYYCSKMISYGYEAISEYMNEEFSLKIAKDFSPVKGLTFYSYGDYQRKKQVVGNCRYNQNYDISQLIKLAVGYENEKDLRFKGAEYFARLSNLKVSEETLRNAKEKSHHIIESINRELEPIKQFELKMIAKSVDQLDLVGIVGMLMGIYDSYGGSEIIEPKAECKAIIQNILIEAIKNNIKNELADEKVVKDATYFAKLNSTLEAIDSVIMYPKDRINYYKSSSDPMRLDTEYASVIESLSVDEVSKTYPDMKHLTSFAQLCSTVRIAKTLHENEIPGLSEKMPFFSNQIELDRKRYEKLEIQRIAIEKKHQAEQERKRLEEDRRKQWKELRTKNRLNEDLDFEEDCQPRNSVDV